jgi:benzoate membrane transport protein
MTDTATPSHQPQAGLLQPIVAGLLGAFVGFASSFTILLAGYAALGANPAEAASALFAISLGTGLLTMLLTGRARMPVTIAWSTPGAALLVATGMPEGGFPAAVGAFLVTALLLVIAGLAKPFGNAVAAIPKPIANAMLAGVLLELCLAPMKAVGELPWLALPIVLAWAVSLRFARLYAVPVAVLVTAIVIGFAVDLPAGALAGGWPQPLLIAPEFSTHAIIGIALPLFIVTMASQNVPGLAVMSANGYTLKPGPIFVATGITSALIAPFGGHSVNLAAITAALCAGPESHPDPARRWIASMAFGISFVVLAISASFAATFIAASPPLLIQAVAGLALLSTLANSASAALADEKDRLPAILTFVTTASGLSFFGIGAAFWGLIAGGLLMAILRLGK